MVADTCSHCTQGLRKEEPVKLEVPVEILNTKQKMWVMVSSPKEAGAGGSLGSRLAKIT